MKPSKDIETMGVYASESQYVTGPTEEQQASGTVPLDTLPADWWNWLWKEITTRINEAASDVQGLYQEILAILGEANITPDPLLTNQLLAAIQVLIRRVGTEAIAGAVKSSVQSGRVSISADGIMTVNGLGTPSTLNTTSHEVVGAINEIHSTLKSYTSNTNTTLQGLLDGKAPTSHANSGTTYGAGTASLYGHVKLSDTANSSLGASNGTAVTPKALAGAVSGKAPTYHVSPDTTYGVGSEGQYGHVKLKDTADDRFGVQSGVAATPRALADAMGGKAPTSHAASGATYGAGTANLYGHVKLSDTADSSLGTSNGTAVTPKALADAVASLQQVDESMQDTLTSLTREKLGKSGGDMTGALSAMAGLRIPTSEPSTPQDGDIWIS